MNRSVANPNTGRRPSAASGFTLVELMITLTLLGILSAAALPSLTRLVRDQRVKTATSDIYASFAYARSEAIKRSANVSLVPTNTSDWALGWQIRDTGGTVLKTQATISGITVTCVTASGSPATSTPCNATVTFQGDGRLTVSSPVFVLKSPDDSTVTARCLRVAPSGSPRIEVDANGNAADGCL